MMRSLILAVLWTIVSVAGAAETLTVTVTNSKPAGPAQSGNANAVAVWVTDSGNTTRIKTFARWVGSSSNVRANNGWLGLTWWESFAGTSDVDGFMGATRGSYGPLVSLGSTGAPAAGTLPIWNMLQKNGTTAPDATYRIWLETATDNNPPLNGGATTTSVNRYNFTFNKNGVPQSGSISGTGYTGTWTYTGRAPTITTQPTNQSVVAPATATFAVVSTGPGAITGYQWQLSTNGGSTWVNVSTGTGGTTASYTTAATAVGDNGSQFHCLVTNAVGTTTSSAATLSVGGPAAPTITTQPASQTVNPGNTPSLTVAATGTSPLAYQWQLSTNGGSTWANVATGSGGTTATYTLAAVAGSDNGNQYHCIVSNGILPNATSSAATLTVRTPPAIAGDPANRTVNVGQTAAFTITGVTGTAPLSYQWQVSTNGGSTWSSTTTGSGGTTASYTTAATVAGDNGKQFRCQVTNATATVATSAAATLTVIVPPAITSQPTPQSVIIGATPGFSVTATGTAPLSYQWQLSTDGGTIWNNVTTGSGGTTASYTLAAVILGDSGSRFRCIVSNASGVPATSSSALLTVNSSIIAPAITTQPLPQVVNVGQTATFSVVATGTAPLAYHWQASSDGGTTWGNVAAGTGATTDTYTTAVTVIGMSGTLYRCEVTNASPAIVDSNPVSLTVHVPAPSAAYIGFTTSPAGGSYAPNHILAVWVETSGGAFVRTIGDWSALRRPFLARWENQSGGDTDGMMGATIVAHSPVRNLVWDLKARGTSSIVADGSYVLWFEMVDGNGASNAANTTSGPGVWMANVPFTITGGSVVPTGPVSIGGITAITINATPAAVPAAAAGQSQPAAHCGGSTLYAVILCAMLPLLLRRRRRQG